MAGVLVVVQAHHCCHCSVRLSYQRVGLCGLQLSAASRHLKTQSVQNKRIHLLNEITLLFIILRDIIESTQQIESLFSSNVIILLYI